MVIINNIEMELYFPIFTFYNPIVPTVQFYQVPSTTGSSNLSESPNFLPKHSEDGQKQNIILASHTTTRDSLQPESS